MRSRDEIETALDEVHESQVRDFKLIMAALADGRDRYTAMRKDLSGMRDGFSGMRQDVSGMRQDVSGMREDVSGMRENLRALDSKMEAVDSHMEAVDSHMEAVDSHMEAVNSSLETADGRLVSLEESQDTVSRALESYYEHSLRKLDLLREASILNAEEDRLRDEARFDEIFERLRRLENPAA